MAPQMSRRELLALGIAIPFTQIRYEPTQNGDKAQDRGPRDTDDLVYDSWLDDYSKDDHHLG